MSRIDKEELSKKHMVIEDLRKQHLDNVEKKVLIFNKNAEEMKELLMFLYQHRYYFPHKDEDLVSQFPILSVDKANKCFYTYQFHRGDIGKINLYNYEDCKVLTMEDYFEDHNLQDAIDSLEIVYTLLDMRINEYNKLIETEKKDLQWAK